VSSDWVMKASGMPIKPPEWSYWIEMKSVKLIEAILLSVDIDPRHVPGRFKRPDTPRIDIPHFQGLRDRTDIALNHYRKHPFERYDLKQPVELKEFRRWAEQLQNPWVFPDGFPEAIVPEISSLPKAGDSNDIDLSFGKANGENSGNLNAVKRGELVKRHEKNWRSIEQDLKDAKTNDLKSAAKIRHGYYDESKAVQWAKNRGKYHEKSSTRGVFDI